MIDGEMPSYQTQPNYRRYHLVIPKIPRGALSMQDSVSGDNNRTPVIFRVLDNLVFVGGITGDRKHIVRLLLLWLKFKGHSIFANFDITVKGIVYTFQVASL